jgi:transposase
MPAVTTSDLSLLDTEQLRVLLAHSQREVAAMKLLVEKMTHEMAVLKRLKFAAKSEAYSPEQRSLLEEAIEADIAAIAGQIDKARGKPAASDDKRRQAATQAPAASGELAASRDQPRTREHDLPLRLRDEAHR